jgi:hypothetical protein
MVAKAYKSTKDGSELKIVGMSAKTGQGVEERLENGW